MPSDVKSPGGERILGQEVRQQEAAFIDHATALFRQALQDEYPRLRGYAFERDTHAIHLGVRLHCEFGAKRIRISLATQPEFSPPVLELKKEVLCVAE